MKFSCEKYLLQSAIAVASRAAASKSPIQALEGLLLEAGADLKVTGYDLKKGIYTTVGADIAQGGRAQQRVGQPQADERQVDHGQQQLKHTKAPLREDEWKKRGQRAIAYTNVSAPFGSIYVSTKRMPIDAAVFADAAFAVFI